MDLQELDETTRTIMLTEFKRDVEQGRLYLGQRLNARGQRRWPDVLEAALHDGHPETLADSIRAEGLLVERETVHRAGKPVEAKVPFTAADTLAEGEFLRFYIRAICVRAVESMVKVQVYRAKEVRASRAESTLKIGQLIDPALLLEDLRTNIGKETMFGLPSGPNSGLCVRLS
ncbi:hypothetical protein [Dactylosporangium sp. NPDC050588]|uniref:hypothetical protein n=1 Tax=Dactylosporangium sp. NPDC050588 TaxID=3157211 RepID=UPI00340B514C